MAKDLGIIAAGHPGTAEAAEAILREGGNAFDAVVGALLAACVAEPVLASLGGGGFALARPRGEQPRLYDFFVQTPRKPRPLDEQDFYPIVADFGTATQEFHIGRGTAAVPGMVRGLFTLHRDLGRMPLREVAAPAIALAKGGVRLNALQAYIFSVIAPIYLATKEAAAAYGAPARPGELVGEGEVLRQPLLADTLDALAAEGDGLFYRGEIAAAIVADMAAGGHLDGEDLARYRVELRAPLALDYAGWRLFTNPPPASGGLLIAFALRLMEGHGFGAGDHDGPAYLERLVRVMGLANEARLDARFAPDGEVEPERLLDPAWLADYRARVAPGTRSRRGTTHVSVMDAAGDVVAATVSNGEGCGALVPGTGIMLNNMLGEEDLNPGGFHRWRPDRRMTSMMSPTLGISRTGALLATGSGGSNRIRSAILHVILNLLDFRMDVEAAVCAPRVHFEEGLLSVEGGFDPQRIAPLLEAFPRHQLWSDYNLFFGGAHTVLSDARGLRGAGDPRRGGVCITVRA